MDPLAEFTKLETWDDDGKPYLKEYAGSGKLKGKKAIITGGDSGIGRAAAQMLAREGADVTIVYLPEEEEEYVKKLVSLIDYRLRILCVVPNELKRLSNKMDSSALQSLMTSCKPTRQQMSSSSTWTNLASWISW